MKNKRKGYSDEEIVMDNTHYNDSNVTPLTLNGQSYNVLADIR